MGVGVGLFAAAAGFAATTRKKREAKKTERPFVVFMARRIRGGREPLPLGKGNALVTFAFDLAPRNGTRAVARIGHSGKSIDPGFENAVVLHWKARPRRLRTRYGLRPQPGRCSEYPPRRTPTPPTPPPPRVRNGSCSFSDLRSSAI